MMTYHKIVFLAVTAITLIMSVAAFIAFCIDKRRAKRGDERVKEKTLLAMAACFGALGAFIGRVVAHHKTAKLYFSIVIWWSLILQAALLCYSAYIAFLF